MHGPHFLSLPLDPILEQLSVRDLALLSCASKGLCAAAAHPLATQTRALRDELRTVVRETVLCGAPATGNRAPSSIPGAEWVAMETSDGPTVWLAPGHLSTYELCFGDGWLLRGWLRCGPAQLRHGPRAPHHLSGMRQHRPGFHVRDLPLDRRSKHALQFLTHLARKPYPDM